MSVWVPPLGLLLPSQLQRPSGEQPELLPQPSNPRKNWYHYGCLACEEICANKGVVASLCTPEEFAVEPFKSKKLEQHLHRVWEEHNFGTKKLKKAQQAVSTLRQQARFLGRKLLECAGLESIQSVGARGGRGGKKCCLF
ncbi:hypothetical protein B0H14DRAFT_2607872 [Mycena olivaceomarginata]|nr:hypothetical protein B0H14DRAFT_2607872 [Mycena olivaceomarginata]